MSDLSRRNFLQSIGSGLLAPGVLAAGAGRVLGLGIDVPEGAAWPQDEPVAWPAHDQSFPALAADQAGNVWLAVLERPDGKRLVRVHQFRDGKRLRSATLAMAGLTGMAAPAVAPRDDGCVVAMAVERADRWQIAYAFVQPEGREEPECRLVACRGTSNINPTLAVAGEKVCLLWESNAGEARGIEKAWLTPEGSSRPQRLSADGCNSYNPAVAATADGTFMAAWDSFRAHSADIYGAACRDGQWQVERRLTSDPRIERHPALAAQGDEVWMAWQAQSYPGIKINGVTEQRIVVARLADDKLEAPLGLFDRVSPAQTRLTDDIKRQLRPQVAFEQASRNDPRLVRPRLGFDPSGRLWLSARRSMGRTAGWESLLWSYAAGQWTGPQPLLGAQGRWQPVTLAFTEQAVLAAVQFDDLPNTWTEQGIQPGWKSGVALVAVPAGAEGADTSYPNGPSGAAHQSSLSRESGRAGYARQPSRETFLRRAQPALHAALDTEPLQMPPTEFNLKAKQDLIAADLPREKTTHEGRELTLFWGDLHDHTDLSVCQRQMNPPGHDLFANARDIERLDFIALTDHGYNFDPPQWALNGEQTRNNHDAGRFVTFLGQEWTSGKNPPADRSRPIGPGNPGRYGHRNLVFLDPYHDRYYDAFDGDISPADLWKQLEGVEFLCIPHQLADWRHKGRGNPPTDWSFTDERLQPVAEVFQSRQSYEYLGCPRQSPEGAPFPGHYLQDAWAQGIVIGVIASPDHGGGSGRVGVWAEELSREAVFEAIRARHTFGTSGAKMSLLVRAGRALMGDKAARSDGPITFSIRAAALRDIEELVLFRNNEVVHRLEPSSSEVEVEWTDPAPPDVKRLWYYARIHAADNELAWSSPIWFIDPAESSEQKS